MLTSKGPRVERPLPGRPFVCLLSANLIRWRQMLTKREEEVLLRIGRSSGAYRSAVLNALDVPIARQLQQRGLVFNCTFDDWFNLTEEGLAEAQALAEARA